jgi:hypothetical protein
MDLPKPKFGTRERVSTLWAMRNCELDGHMQRIMEPVAVDSYHRELEEALVSCRYKGGAAYHGKDNE